MEQVVRSEGETLTVTVQIEQISSDGGILEDKQISSVDHQLSESSTDDKHLLQNLEPESTSDHTELGELFVGCDNSRDYVNLCEDHEPGESPRGDKNLPEYLQLEQLDHDVIEENYIESHIYESFDFGVTIILILYYMYSI